MPSTSTPHELGVERRSFLASLDALDVRTLFDNLYSVLYLSFTNCYFEIHAVKRCTNRYCTNQFYKLFIFFKEVEPIDERTGGHEILFVHIDPKYNSIAVIVTSIIFYNMKFYPIQCIDMH